ncbi:MAG: DUF4377 domain-containing protein [Arenimonas sp.]|nr:DUF4377 domain-containing protein [Arenimonas sp.]
MSLLRPCLVLAAALSFGLAGCATTASGEAGTTEAAASAPAGAALPPEGREIIVNVAGQRAPCEGAAPMLCLQVRTQPGAPWQLHYFDIEGFNWQSGTEYVIRVREFPVADPPADAPSLRWVLEEVLESGPAL